MPFKMTEMVGCEFPLFAFSHCRDVVVAVSKAGGMGIFGAVNLPPERLREELDWIDVHVDGKPYGVDLIAEKVEEESTIVEILELDVAYGQGHLFGSPRPVKDEILDTAVDSQRVTA